MSRKRVNGRPKRADARDGNREQAPGPPRLGHILETQGIHQACIQFQAPVVQLQTRIPHNLVWCVSPVLSRPVFFLFSPIADYFTCINASSCKPQFSVLSQLL